ncbi:hypothetical protein DAH55_18475 [Sphingomonas koreensis]|uniref:hypothetical protein n=1 Tax=Sphingomonas koreensis TaxID=93064 RepID=UPI00082D47EC|nr:hypothetical protein [Sphingomonas koreensis]PJI89547.1 hypothetical protein BDW16_2862 [Sphingomonas koreensis]RSU64900.1 hypothetical protein DAH55_18475 [Sphingomonas koreensis]
MVADAFTGYRRRVRVVPGDGRIEVDMEDDAHCFGVSLIHDGARIEAVETRAPRYPWSTCPAAGGFLAQRMAGVALADAALVENQRDHCTHLYDLFVVAARHALDPAPFTYDIRVSDPVEGVIVAEIDRDGETLLHWQFDDVRENAVGVPTGDRRAFDAWTRAQPENLIEGGLMLRRGVMVSGTRFFDFPVGAAASAMSQMIGSCFTYAPERAGQALREPDTIRDFSNHPEKMLSGERDD